MESKQTTPVLVKQSCVTLLNKHLFSCPLVKFLFFVAYTEQICKEGKNEDITELVQFQSLLLLSLSPRLVIDINSANFAVLVVALIKVCVETPCIFGSIFILLCAIHQQEAKDSVCQDWLTSTLAITILLL